MTATMDSLPGRSAFQPSIKLTSAPSTAEAAHIEGIAHYKADRFEQALACFNHTISLQPTFASAYNSRGFVLQDLGRLEEALGDFSRAVELGPELAMSRLNLGMLQLKLGQFDAGWSNYEARWTGAAEYQAGQFKRPECQLPIWEGVSDAAPAHDKDRSILVITEQGFGDTFQFARYLPLLAKRFKKVGFACSEPTRRLVDWSFGDEVVSFTRMPASTAWDVQCALMSLPKAFGTRLGNMPGGSAYLRVPSAASLYWKERLDAAAPNKLRVGLAWAGRAQHHRDARRSLKLAQLTPLLSDQRVAWVSLQKWTPQDVRPDVPKGVAWFDWTDELGDFADSAALVSELDLVISVDSAMVHLAGALDKPVWMLDRFDNEWRWLSGRQDSPWYPQMRIFRQSTFGDWAPVIEGVAQALADLPNPRASALPAREPEAMGTSKQKGLPAPGQQPQALSIDQAMQRAAQLQSAGRLQEAERVIRAILQAKPDHARALHLLGLVAYQAGQPAQAVAFIQQAIAAAPHDAVFHSNIAEMNRQLGRLPQAIQHGERAVALSPSMACGHSNLGIAYFDAGDDDKAKACHERALAIEPRTPNSLNNLGSIARRAKDPEAAVAWYRQALNHNPDYLEAASNLGAVLVELHRPDEAAPLLEQVLQRRPQYPEALCSLGLARLKQGRFAEAQGLLRRALQLSPGYVEAMVGLARSLKETQAYPEAFSLIRGVLGRFPDRPDAWFVLGSLHRDVEELDEAQAAFEKSLALAPDSTDALIGLGNLRREQGKLDDAEQLLNKAIDIDPNHAGARFHLVQVRKMKPGDANLAVLEATLAQSTDAHPAKLISLHYALGKAYDDLKDWDKAFPHFLEGAKLKRAQLSFSAQEDAERTQRIETIFNADFMARMQGAGDSSDVPVFVLGMPRSGTTLTEQIIASHPDVHGAGELRDLMAVLHQAPGAGGPGPYPDRLLQADKGTITAWGAEYVRLLRARAPTARRITDKMPANYFALGMIHLMLPKARIIHVRRNAADTCVSCFTRLFNKQQDATYDLHELGLHYANYERLMAHWRRVLPTSSFIDVQYEDIVADMQGQARRLIDWCGLEWHDACLAQVRQPIHGSSVERWRRYEAYLEPLLSALGDYAPRRRP